MDMIAGRVALRVDAHVDGDGGASASRGPSREREHVAEAHRLMELDRLDRDGDPAMAAMAPRLDVARLIDEGEDHAAEDAPLVVRVLGRGEASEGKPPSLGVGRLDC